MNLKKISRFGLGFAALLTSIVTLHAGTHTWKGGAGNGLWSSPSNWESSNPPFANESPLHLVFPENTNAAHRLSTNNIPNLAIDSMTFDEHGYVISGTGLGTNIALKQPTFPSIRTVSVSTYILDRTNRFDSSLHIELRGKVVFYVERFC